MTPISTHAVGILPKLLCSLESHMKHGPVDIAQLAKYLLDNAQSPRFKPQQLHKPKIAAHTSKSSIQEVKAGSG